MQTNKINPIIKGDFPDPCVIRVEDTYYMLSTTMHFMPGGVILKSYNLVDWEIEGYVFEKLNDTSEEKMEGEKTNYGHGMWSGTLRYYKETFYVSFVDSDKNDTHLFTAKSVKGPWEKKTIKGHFHHGSLLFDGEKVYLVYGQSQIRMIELEEDLSKPKTGGLERTLVEEKDDVYLGYEGSHMMKVNDKYYLFLIHWPKAGMARRTQMCFWSDSLEGEFQGSVIFDNDGGYFNQGMAQGGLIDTPKGDWYAILFQDHGAVGRIPVLLPVSWEKEFPVLGNEGAPPDKFSVPESRPYYRYRPLYDSDNFKGKLKNVWQWNHQPDQQLWRLLKDGGLAIKTGKISTNLAHAVNTLTQRMKWPTSQAEVWVDAEHIKEGDFAGLCALQGCYGMVAITREVGRYYLVMIARELEDTSFQDKTTDYLPGSVFEKIELPQAKVKLRLVANFENMQDWAEFYYEQNGKWNRIGKRHKLYFKLDHFAGCRYGLFHYATKEIGGEAVFYDFIYE